MSDPLIDLLQQIHEQRLTPDEAANRIRSHMSHSLEFATVDHDRKHRCGAAEVVYGAGKTPDQVVQIVKSIRGRNPVALVTRATPEQFQALTEAMAGETILASGRRSTLLIGSAPAPLAVPPIAIVTAGTSDEPVAEEAAMTCLALGHPIHRINDVGVAGLHRLGARLPEIRASKVILCIAGMEGALPSVLGGLVDATIIAVPTSVGYGASFGGVAALLGMLNSCSSGLLVVNIDNGFGAAFAACRINRLGAASI